MPDKAPAKAELRIDDKVLDLPVIVGSEDEHGLDIGKIRAQTEWLKASMRSGVEDPRLEECYQSFRTRTDAWVDTR